MLEKFSYCLKKIYSKIEFQRIVTLFLLGGFLGWCWEILVNEFKTIKYDKYLKPLPILTIYGVGTVAIYYFSKLIRNRSLGTKMVIYAGVLAGLEVICGIFSILINKKLTWQYANNLPISEFSVTIFTCFALIFDSYFASSSSNAIGHTTSTKRLKKQLTLTDLNNL